MRVVTVRTKVWQTSVFIVAACPTRGATDAGSVGARAADRGRDPGRGDRMLFKALGTRPGVVFP
jgi:hypothetical protein